MPRFRFSRLIPLIMLTIFSVMASSGRPVAIQKALLSGEGSFPAKIKEHFKAGAGYDWQPISKEKGLDGSVLTRFQQTFMGNPVEGAIVILRSDNREHSMSGYFADLSETAVPYMNSTDWSEVIARSGLIADMKETNYRMSQVWIEVDSGYEQALKIESYSEKQFSHQTAYLNPATSEIIQLVEHKCHLNHVGTALTSYHGSCQITTQFQLSQYQLRSSDRGNGIITLNLNHQLNYQSVSEIADDDNLWDQSNAPFATDAHFCAEKYYDFLQNRFQRNSLDNAGYILKSYINYGQNLANAFWNGSAVVYGSGNGTNGVLTVIDIAGHEFTHGLIQKTAGLNYANEPGTINEAVADIFGVALDHFAFPAEQNWTIGERSGQPFRNFADPLQYGQPREYLGQGWYFGTGDNGGVHINSGFINHWYYLMSTGGTGVNSKGWNYNISGTGWEKSLSIVYHSLLAYLVPQSGFKDLYEATIHSAIDLYGYCSAEHLAVIESWKAVGYQNPLLVNPVIHSLSNMFCQGQTLELKASGMPGSEFEWYLDGIAVNLSGLSISIDVPGVYQVSESRCGAMLLSSPITITTTPKPQPFTSTVSGCPGEALVLSGYPSGGIFSVPNPYFGAQTSFTYTFTDSTGCSASVQGYVYRYLTHPPHISAEKNQVPVNGQPVQLFTDSGTVFSGAGVVGSMFDPQMAGIGGPYPVETNYVDQNGCYLKNSTSITVLPPCRKIAESPSIEVNRNNLFPDYISLRAIGAEGYDTRWEIAGSILFSGNASESSIKIFIDSEVTEIRLWYRNTCGDSSSVNQTIIKSLPETVNVYPNPATESFIIDGKEIFSVSLFDSRGKIMMNERYLFGQQQIRVRADQFAAGIYSLEVQDGTKFFRKKIAVK